MEELRYTKTATTLYLNCHSCFSLRYGVMTVDELVALAKQHQIEALALTDIQNGSACFDFVQACRKEGIEPIIGMEFRREGELLYVALAKNLQGFQEINTFYADYSLKGQAFPDLPPPWSHVFVIYPWSRQDRSSLSENEYLGIKASEIPQLLRSRYRHRQEQLVILQPLTFIDKRGYHLHRLLRAIDHNTLLSKLSASQHEAFSDAFVPPEELREAFADYTQILRNTEQLAQQCSFDFQFGKSRTRQSFTGGKYEDMLLLEKLAMDGLERRYGPHHRVAKERIKREIDIIVKLNFNAHFLITWDFVRYGQHRGFFHVGRGSCANSVVSYCLGITDVDPIELDLYFERFLNPKQKVPPDFDIDYSWKERDEIIEYIFRRYRYAHTAMLATYNCFKQRSSIRELGKVFGLPKAEIDLLIQRSPPSQQLDKLSRQVLHYAHLLEGKPNHLGVHAGGILIAEDPICATTALDLPPKGFQISHIDMHVAETVGLYKFDVLSQRGLGHIQDTVKIVAQNRQEAVDVHDILTIKADQKIKQLISQGQTMGCFYVESPAMRQLLRKLNCTEYLELVAASSIIRPGVARSGMMRTYIERYNGKHFEHLHPELEELLGDTYGIMVYQEDVIKVVNGFAGFSFAEAELLRRAMSGKTRGMDAFEQIKERFWEACREKKYAESLIQEVWRQIESFAGYSFSKAHSASFAVESLQSLYLKAYYPLEFMVGVINNFGGFYDAEIYLHEARMWGASIHAPCVNHSQRQTTIIGKDIYIGFGHLKSLHAKVIESLLAVRGEDGPFANIEEFVRRVPISIEQLEILIRIGAFRFTGKSKYSLLWEMQYRLKIKKVRQPKVLFVGADTAFDIPHLPISPLEDAYDEIELLGFPLCSPFKLVSHIPEDCLLQSQLPSYLGQQVRMLGYLITVKTTTTIKGEAMHFANFFDQAGMPFDVTIFPDVAKRTAFIGRGLYVLEGKVVAEFGCYSLEISKMQKYLFLMDPRVGD